MDEDTPLLPGNEGDLREYNHDRKYRQTTPKGVNQSKVDFPDWVIDSH